MIKKSPVFFYLYIYYVYLHVKLSTLKSQIDTSGLKLQIYFIKNNKLQITFIIALLERQNRNTIVYNNFTFIINNILNKTYTVDRYSRVKNSIKLIIK